MVVNECLLLVLIPQLKTEMSASADSTIPLLRRTEAFREKTWDGRGRNKGRFETKRYAPHRKIWWKKKANLAVAAPPPQEIVKPTSFGLSSHLNKTQKL